MGMYTELVCAFVLKDETPAIVTGTLAFMAGYVRSQPDIIPDHCLFEDGGWERMLWGASGYFVSSPPFIHTPDYPEGGYEVAIRCNIKNFDFDIERFIDWITPYIAADKGEFLGYMRYEEDARPTLLVHPGKWVEPWRSRFWWRRWLNRG